MLFDKSLLRGSLQPLYQNKYCPEKGKILLALLTGQTSSLSRPSVFGLEADFDEKRPIANLIFSQSDRPMPPKDRKHRIDADEAVEYKNHKICVISF